MKSYRFDQSRNISGTLSIFIIMAMSIATAWFCLKTAQKVVDNAPDSAVFNIQKR